MKKTIQGKEFDVPRLTRAQIREVRKRGFDLVSKAFKLGGNDVPITGEELDALLDVAFVGHDDAIEVIGLPGRIELGSAVLTELFSLGNELKN